MSLKLGTTDIAGISTNKILTGWNIFDCKWSDHIINDIQWLRGDTFSWQSGSVYTTAYNKLVTEYSTGTEETDSAGITFKRSTNGFKIADASQESAILSKYNSDGIAWYYILDTTNKQFKLPRTKFGFEGLRDNVGDDIDESLPNITGSFTSYNYQNGTQSGSVSYSVSESSAIPPSSGAISYGTFSFDASLSSSTYQNNAPVQERATQMYLYFYVGEYSQTAIEQTAGITSEQLNAKVDTSSLVEVNPMIESYVNGTSGYNIWANGYCEQWGTANISSTSTPTNCYFLKTMIDINYNVSYMARTDSVQWSTSYVVNPQCITKDTTYISLVDNLPYNTSAMWKVCGYLAEGQY